MSYLLLHVAAASGEKLDGRKSEAAPPLFPSRLWRPRTPALRQASPLVRPARPPLRVARIEELFAATQRARPGDSILIADGRYVLPRRLEIKADGVTLRGASGRRENVVLDGDGTLGELLAVTACSDVTIADLTIQNVKWNGIKINSETGVHRLLIHNCVLHNIWQRAIKGVHVPPENRERLRPTACRVQGCLIYNDRPKAFSDDETDTAQTYDGNYVGGIDVMFAKNWVISDNVFWNIQGRTHAARGAIFLWHHSEDCLIERNVIVDCDAGICLGNSHRGDSALHATRATVRNNFVMRAPEGGIVAAWTRDCRIVHNTVCDPQNRLGRLLRFVHDNDGLFVANNLLSGPGLPGLPGFSNESPSRITLRNNVVKDVTASLSAPQRGDLRLTPRTVDAMDKGLPLAEARQDIERRPRDATPDVGAHELSRS